MTMTPFANNSVNDRRINDAPLLKGEGLLSLLNDLGGKGLLEWNVDQQLAKVGKKLLTEFAYKDGMDTPMVQGFRSWLQSQGFRGSRRSRSYYLSLAELEARAVTITAEGKAQVCEAKAAKPKATAVGGGGFLAGLMG